MPDVHSIITDALEDIYRIQVHSKKNKIVMLATYDLRSKLLKLGTIESYREIK